MSVLIIVLYAVFLLITLVITIAVLNARRMKKERMERHNYVEFEAMREEMLYREREHKASKDRVEGLCKEYEETFRAMQIMDELEGRQ